MNLRTFGALLLRNRLLTGLAILVTVVGALGTLVLLPPTYQTVGSVVLIPPPDPVEPAANRYLALGSVDQAIDVVVRTLDSDQVHAEVARSAPGGSYDVVTDWSSSAPILLVTATGGSSADATATLDAVLAQVPQVLGDLQESLSIAQTAQITQLPLTRSREPVRLAKPAIRAAVVAGGLMMVLTAGIIAAYDGFRLRRRMRLPAPPDELLEEPVEPEPAEPEPQVEPEVEHQHVATEREPSPPVRPLVRSGRRRPARTGAGEDTRAAG
jgi:hypothetical protein